jgi:hypothetical protein
MRVSVLIHAPKTFFVFGIFFGCDSRIRLRLGLSLRPETYLYRGVFFILESGSLLPVGGETPPLHNQQTL